MSGGGTEREQVTTAPWAAAQPYILDFMERAGQMSESPLEYGPQRVAGQSYDTINAYDLTRELQEGGPVNAANTFLGDVLGGEFMPDRNPYLDETFEAMSGRITDAYNRTVAPGTASRFVAAGQTGSSGYEAARDRDSETLARELGDLGTNIYYGDYERRMGDRFRAAGMAGSNQAAELQAIGALGEAGMSQDLFNQRLLDDAIARFSFAQTEPEERLDRFGQRINLASRGYGTSEQLVPTSNPGLSAGLGVLGLLGQLGGAYLMGG